MAAALMTEAASEGYEGRVAAANVIANRAYVGGYGDGIQGVVEKGIGTSRPEFSGPTRERAAYNSYLAQALAAYSAGTVPKNKTLADIMGITEGVLTGNIPDITQGATIFVGSPQAMLAESGGKRSFSSWHQNKFDAFGSLQIGTQTFGYGSKEEQQKAMQRAGLIHEPATGLTIPSPTGPFDTWGDAGRAEVAAGQFGNIRGLNDFGAPVQTGIPESEQRANDLMGGVPDFGMIDAATPATPLDASPVGPVQRGPDLADLSVGPSGVSGAWDAPKEGSYGVSGDFAPGYDPLGSISAPSAGVEQNANLGEGKPAQGFNPDATFAGASWDQMSNAALKDALASVPFDSSGLRESTNVENRVNEVSPYGFTKSYTSTPNVANPYGFPGSKFDPGFSYNQLEPDVSKQVTLPNAYVPETPWGTYAGPLGNLGYDPLSSIQAPTAPGKEEDQSKASFGNKDVYDTASDPFSGMMGAPWAGGATGEWDGVPNGSFGVSGGWDGSPGYSWSGPLADRASPVSYTTPATGDYGYSPTDGYGGGSDYGNPGRGLSPGGPMVGGWQGPSPQDYTGDMGFHGVPQQGYTPTPTVSPYGFSGLDLGTGTGVGGFLSGSPYGVTPSSNSNAGFGWAMSPSGWSGFDVSGGYSGGSFDGSPGYGITPTAPATTYQPSSYTSVPDTPDVQQSVQSSVSRPATTYQTVVQKTLNPDWTAYQAQQQEAPATPTLDTTFGAVPSMVGDLGYVSDLGATNVTPTAAKAPPKYITTTVQVPIEAPKAIAAPGQKPKAQVDKQAQAAAQWAKDTTLAASDARINATLAANRPIVDPLTGQTLIDAQQPGVMDKIAQAIKGVLPGWAPATPTYTGDVRSGTGAYNAGGWGSYGMNASQIAGHITAGRMAPGPLGLGNGYAGTGYTINDIAANYYNGGLGGGVQVGGSNWAGNQGGLGNGWQGSYSGSINGSGGYNGNHGGFNGTGGLY